MTKKTRRLIFYIFLVLFIFVALVIVFYALGYTFDWQKKSLTTTGAFYFKSHPDGAKIYINNEYAGDTNKFIRRLTPKNYDIKISKSDYYDWQKTLDIKSGLVTEAENIFLIKNNYIANSVTDANVGDFFFSPDGTEVIYVAEKPVAKTTILTLRLMNLTDNTDVQIYPLLIPSISSGFTQILPGLKNLAGIVWSNDKNKILLSFSDNSYYVVFLRNEIKIINLQSLIQYSSNYTISSVKNPLIHPQDSNKIYFYFSSGLYFVKLNESEPYESIVSLPMVSNVSSYTIFNNEILYIQSSKAELYKTNFDGSSFKKVFDIPLLKPNESATIINDKLIIINKILYLFEPKLQIFKKIVDGVKDFHFSNNEDKFLWITDNEIGIIWLKPDFEQPMRQEYDMESIIKIPQKINQAIWYSKSNQHIIYATDNEINIVELDNREKRNAAKIFSVENPEIFYNKQNNKLYILSKEKFLEITISD